MLATGKLQVYGIRSSVDVEYKHFQHDKGYF